MQLPAANRPASPAASEASSSSMTGSLASFRSSSSTGSTRSVTYTRDELLTIGTSPLSNSRASSQLASVLATIPQIMRSSRRGVLEAFQTLEYSRTQEVEQTHTPSPSSSRSSSKSRSSPKRRSPKRHQFTKVSKSPSQKTLPDTQVENDSVHTGVIPIVAGKVDVYIPPQRRVIVSSQQALLESQQQQRQRQLPGGRGRSGSLSGRQGRMTMRSWPRQIQPLTPLTAIQTTNGLPSAILAGW